MSKYSYEFKKKIVLEYLAGEGGPVTLARKYGIPSETRIKEWIKAYQKQHICIGKNALIELTLTKN